MSIQVFRRKKLKKYLYRLVIALFALFSFAVLLSLIFLFTHSSGKLPLFLDEKGNVLANSISEKINVEINGVQQGMIVRGRDLSNPVILFVHGGPGMPEYFMFEKYISGLENDFTLCWWDQRGAGLSFSPSIPQSSMNTEQFIADGEAVTHYLQKRFKKDKIYLMGHSWGSYLAIQIAERHPELYRAYIGVAQIAYQMQSEKLAYAYMLTQHRILGNRIIQKLLKYPILDSDKYFYPYTDDLLRDKVMLMLGVGVMRDMDSVITGIFLPVMSCSAYTITEKINFWRGKLFSRKSEQLHREMYETDLIKKVPELKIPTLFICGVHDLTVSFALSEQYFRSLHAPQKTFYRFEHSAHSPQFEEPEHFLKIMREDLPKL